MKITLHYDFNEMSQDGRDSILVKGKDFRYDVDLKKKDLNLTVPELVDKYHDDALSHAAYNLRCQMALADGNTYY